MPTYEFKCEDCGMEFAFFLSRTISDEDKVCPECKSEKVRQRFTGTNWLPGDSCNRDSGSCGSSWGFG